MAGKLGNPFTLGDVAIPGASGPDGVAVMAVGPMPFEAFLGGGAQESESAIYGFNVASLDFADIVALFSASAFLITSEIIAVPTPRLGSASSLRVVVFTNTLNAAMTVTLLADGVAVPGATLVIPASTTGSFGPVAGPFPIAAGAVLSFRIQSMASMGASSLTGSVEWQPT